MKRDSEASLTIPAGAYCHEASGRMAACPHWGLAPDASGAWCHFLDRGDEAAQALSGLCRLVWSSWDTGAVGGTLDVLAPELPVGTLGIRGKECGIPGGTTARETVLRIPGRTPVRYLDGQPATGRC